MALRPPKDFTPATGGRARPSDAELLALWRRHEATRQERERTERWRAAQGALRRNDDGTLHTVSPASALPAYLREEDAFGPDARAALRPLPRDGRVVAVGVDTLSPCWYAETGSPLARAMRALATLETAGRARLLPEPVRGYRIGWFPGSGLVFAEGRPGGEALCAATELPGALRRLHRALADLGIPTAAVPSAGIRRLDVAADILSDSAVEGLALLECISTAALGAGKLASYRAERRTESVLVKTRAGRTLARVYDKGAQLSAVSPGRWIRFEAQWRFPRGARPSPERLDATQLRRRFARRFEPLWRAAAGLRLATPLPLAEQIGAAVASGRLAPSRARTVAGYLLLSAAGVAQGARRTTYELERECRELGLSVSLADGADRRIDVARVLDECTAPQVWGSPGL
jgi:hypothetical protein